MAESMMRAPVGSSLKVSGIKIAVPAAGPRPGSTPMNVPRTQPMRAKARYCRLSAAVRPAVRCASVSIACSASHPECADRQRHLEPVVEDVEDAEAPRECRQRDCDRGPCAENEQHSHDEWQHGQPV